MKTILTPKFRASYPSVFKAKKNDLSGKDEFSVVALFAKDADLKPLEKAALEVVKEKWGDDAKVSKNAQGAWTLTVKGKTSPFRMPFRDQGEREGENGTMPSGYVKGAVFVNLKTTQKPGLVNQQNEDIIEETEFYAGCYARAAVSCFAYDQKGNKGVSFGLQALQKVAEGEPLSGRAKAQDLFQPVSGFEGSKDAEELFS